MKIEKPGEYRTQDGRKATVWYINAKGFAFGEIDFIPCIWVTNGRLLLSTVMLAEIPADIISPWSEPKSVTLDVWLWLRKDRTAKASLVAPNILDQTAGTIGATRVSVTVTEGVWE